MILSIYPSADATIYESNANQNTGLDEILELDKRIGDASLEFNTNSRILMKFDINNISNILTKFNISNPEYFLNLYTLSATEIPISYTLEAYAVSQSWEMGIGKKENTPITTNGVSWIHRDSSNGIQWSSSSISPNSECAYSCIPGGATWYTSYNATQSYSYANSDLNMNITNIVNAWISGSIYNDGLILKRLNVDESSSLSMGNLQFFSRDTHTIYPPKLNIAWDDSTYITGSLTQINSNDNFLIYSPNLEKSYNENAKVKIRIIGREKYPMRNYSTSSVYTTVTKCLPETSCYSIIDATSQDTVIPFDDNYTKLSCDTNGNFFKFWMNSLQPERIYRLLIKVTTIDTEEIFDDFIFKVVR